MTQYQSKSKKGQFNQRSAGGNSKSRSALRAGQEKVRQLENQAQQMIGRQDSYLAVMNAKFKAEEENRSQVFKFETEQEDRFQEQVIENYNQKITNAQVEGQKNEAIFKSLANMSDTAGKQAARIVQARQDEHNRNQVNEGTTAAYDINFADVMTPFEWEANEKKATKQAEERKDLKLDEAKRLYTIAQKNKIAGAALEEGQPAVEVERHYGVDWSVEKKQSFLKTQIKQFFNWIDGKGQDFKVSTKNIVGYKGNQKVVTLAELTKQGDGETARAVETFLYNSLIETYAESGLSNAFILEYARIPFNEKQDRNESSRYATQNKLAADRMEVKQAEGLHYALQQPGDNVVSTWMNSQYDKAQAKDLLYSQLEMMFKEGLVDDPVLYFNKLTSTQMVDIGGKEMSLKDAWGGELQYQILYQKAVDARRVQSNKTDQLNETQVKQHVTGVTKAALENGTMNRAEHDKAIAFINEQQAITGVDMSRYRNQISNIFKSSQPGRINLETTRYNLNNQLAAGTLTPIDIEESGLPLPEQQKLMGELKKYGPADGGGDGKEDIKAFNTLIRSFGDNGRLDNSTNYTFIGAEAAAESMYIRRFEVYKKDPKLSPAEARLKARNDVIAEIQKKQGMFYVEEDLAKQQKYGRGQAYFPHFMVGGGASTPSGIGPGAGAALIEKVRQDGALIDTEELASEVELKTIANNIKNGKSFHVPYFIQEVAKQTGEDEIEILNRQLTRAGHTEQSKRTQWKDALITDTDTRAVDTYLQNYRGAASANVAVAVSPNAMPAKIPLGKVAGGNAVRDIAIKLGSGIPEIFVGMYGFDSNGYTVTMPIAYPGESSPAQRIKQLMGEINIDEAKTYGEALAKLPDGAQKTYVENHLKFQQINLNAPLLPPMPVAQNPTFMSRNSRSLLQSQRPFGPGRGAAGGGSTQRYNSMDQIASPEQIAQTNIGVAKAAESEVGMNTAEGPDAGRNACVYAVNKVLAKKGIKVPWGNSLYVPYVKQVLDKKGTRLDGPQPGAIVIMQDNYKNPSEAYPHIGIVQQDGRIISNSSSRARFDRVESAESYERYYGKPNLYYSLE